MHKRIIITIDPEQIDSEFIKIRTQINGFGVQSVLHEKIKHQNEFTTYFDLIWQSIGEDIKQFYLDKDDSRPNQTH